MSLTEHQKRLKRQIIKHSKNIKQKLSDLKKFEQQYLQFNTETFKPITDPLGKIADAVDDNPKSFKLYGVKDTRSDGHVTQHEGKKPEDYALPKDEDGDDAASFYPHSLTPTSTPIKRPETYTTPDKPSVNDYLEPLINPVKGRRGYDNVYGPKYKDSNVMLADSELIFDSSGKTVTVENLKFNVTPGLLELIFKSYPKHFDKYDLKKYKEILNLTNIHKENAHEDGSILVTSTNKYKKIISQLFKDDILKKNRIRFI